MTFDAIVLCGGPSRRLGGADKASVIVGGRSLLERALDAVRSADRIIAVGPHRDVAGQVVWTQEDPPGGGPVSAIDAAVIFVEAPVVVVLGVDFPFVDDARVQQLLELVGERDGAILRDETGRHQFLIGAYRRAALVRALQGRDPQDMSVKEMIGELDLLLLDDPRSTRDCDTWDDVARAEEMFAKERQS